MTQKFKDYNLVHYCVGWNFDGPIYATHFIATKKAYQKDKKYPVLKGWKYIMRHERNK